MSTATCTPETTTHLDDTLQDLDLSKEETDQLLTQQKYESHRQLRRRLITQQLQLAAQDCVRSALQRLVEISESQNPLAARLAATQILAYAGTPPLPPPPPLTAIACPLYKPHLPARGGGVAQYGSATEHAWPGARE